MRLALSDASLGPAEIAAIIGASNGSPVLDRLEAEAIAEVFGDQVDAGGVDQGSHRGIGRGRRRGPSPPGFVDRRGRARADGGLVPPDDHLRIRVSRGAQPVEGDTFLVNSVASGGTNYSSVVRVRRPS